LGSKSSQNASIFHEKNDGGVKKYPGCPYTEIYEVAKIPKVLSHLPFEAQQEIHTNYQKLHQNPSEVLPQYANAFIINTKMRSSST